MKMHLNNLRVIASLSSLLLSSCSLLSPVTPSDESAYLIKSIPDTVPVKHQHNTTILLTQPTTTPIYDTRNMAYSKSPYQISYYAKNSWAETPSDMLLPLMIKTIQKTHYFKAVVSSPYTGAYSYLLTTQITELLQDYTGKVPVLKFSLRAQLSNGVTGRIIEIKEFTHTIPLTVKNPYGGVLAANKATADTLEDLARWVTTK